MCQSTLVNTSIFCSTTHQVLLPWKILQSGRPGQTIEQFYHGVAVLLIASSSQSNTFFLDKDFLGRSKTNLDEIDMLIPLHVDVVVATYGRLVWYITSQQIQQLVKGKSEIRCILSDDMLSMPAMSPKLPQRKIEHNSKDRLFNSILEFLQERELAFSTSLYSSRVSLVHWWETRDHWATFQPSTSVDPTQHEYRWYSSSSSSSEQALFPPKLCKL